MDSLRALIAAAGRGTRAGLDIPKTLFPVAGTPILVRIAQVLEPYDPHPTIIVSPSGERQVAACLNEHGLAADLVIQSEPRGMGDAVLRFEQSHAFAEAEHLVLVWGDIPFIQPATLAAVIEAHRANDNDFTFATRQVDSAYTIVSRGSDGAVEHVIETREQSAGTAQSGEREIGLFVFRVAPVFAALREDSPGKFGRTTGEHGFLYVIGLLVARGLKVQAICCATEFDLVSLNSLADVADYI